eukprot:CAMPEP_0197638462 /NCGR_PEP_ID=MMETSP1338-20131121/13383_1 /TAXON_ID=43686 ORGANISM="Pelagodinium beii, Strain RCC1491" /NCGR_SAMPLE_ID=MMETSP1338 /ASSEMBLY_ACC=CAM_ASM_000754 /LENGTH=462 /DNA_ID=CAMNT_0043211045 /DNA_START=95 /DNA_END=1483 /DNA_ORIENTATION=-
MARKHSWLVLLLFAGFLVGVAPSFLEVGLTSSRSKPRRALAPESSVQDAASAAQNLLGTASEISWLSSFAAVLVLLAATVVPGAAVAENSSKSMAAVAPCLLSKCQVPLAKCILDPSCAANLTCIIACAGSPDESACQIKCGDNFEDNTVVEFNACALSAKKCVPQRPDVGAVPGEAKWEPVKGRYPIPPPESVSNDFDVTKMNGRWYITSGLNPLFDTFDCQVHFFEGTAAKGDQPGQLVGKINWRISEVDGEFIPKSTVQTFKQTSPGVLENHGNEYLHYQDDWYVLDHADEADPELGFVLIYYRGQNDAWAGYGGGTLYTRAKTIPPQILDRVRAATAKANVPYDKFWKSTDNTCATAGDPVKLRAQYAERLVQQAEMSAEQQLTLLQRSTFSKVDREEKKIVRSAQRLEKMTEDFVKSEVQFIGAELQQAEREIEKDELLLEAPFRSVLNFFRELGQR